ncbi:UV damage repair protein UvrX [Anaerobacillus alkaliphilus]|uniref:UV damage repair protein UvrX n=1 Tax=Anaerobacillus alkaliphilus TaxID=1548597 RepID=A0A4Q0VSM6_9BACI|nr:UV damage repair protein UvrX [Anaerobacillus alkaliphilus]RXI99571.1 UV damage repair protein UvrX [Anaerobacillus alkaliphilus]
MRIDYPSLPARTIFCIDMKSFYASCSALLLGLDPLTAYLAVVGDTERDGSIVLAATPRLKSDFGIKTGNRLFEIPKDPRIKIVNAQMSTYLQVSTRLTSFFNQYVPLESIHTYSVDESFLDVKGTTRLWGSAWQLAQRIREDMLAEFGLSCSIGIGPNMLLSKVCLDLEAKKAGIAEWGYSDVKKKLWPVSPLREMWGIGSRMEKRLNKLGIFSIGQLAEAPLSLLEKNFGIMGNQLYYHAHGVDLSDLGAPIVEGQISFGKSQILLRDYQDLEEIKHVILEMCEEVARRARTATKAGRTISLGIGYSKDEAGGGFHRSTTLQTATNITLEIYDACLQLFGRYYRGETVRSISIALSNVVSDDQIQLSFLNPNKPRQRDLGYIMDFIREKHGSDKLLRAVSYTKAGTAKHRSKLVGGHKA